MQTEVQDLEFFDNGRSSSSRGNTRRASEVSRAHEVGGPKCRDEGLGDQDELGVPGPSDDPHELG